MLLHLCIRNIVLIEALDIEFTGGLSVLTGETGAGKSILLDALGLALGSRADFGLIRANTDKASVTASFDITPGHPVWSLLDDAGIEPSSSLILRRQLRADGKSPAHINDQPVSVQLLRQCGDMLVEIQGQFEGRGLLDVSTHLHLLDRASGAAEQLAALAQSWADYRTARNELEACRQAQEQARAEEDWLRDAVNQLDLLAAQPGEEAQLSEERSRHANSTRIAEALQQARQLMENEGGALSATGRALNLLERQHSVAGSLLEPAIDALGRALAELNEAESQISHAGDTLDSDPERLAGIEDRLHSLRAAARKHNIQVDELADLHTKLTAQLAAIDDQSGHLAQLAAAADKARQRYLENAQAVSEIRETAARHIDAAVRAELPPLKLETADFRTSISRLDEDRWGPLGWDRVRFTASTNPGMDMGPVDQIASGGELARFLLALKVVLSENETPKTLIFDEVDSGVGGAVAAAVGARLARLGMATQTLVITHSPQVAGQGQQHLRIAKLNSETGIVSATSVLDNAARIEEIARMLSADRITAEARAAAVNLLGSGR